MSNEEKLAIAIEALREIAWSDECAQDVAKEALANVEASESE